MPLSPASWWRTGVQLLLLLLPLAALSALLLAVFGEHPIVHAIVIATVAIGGAATLGLGVWRLCARWPWPTRFSPRFCALHAAAALLFAALWVTVFVTITALLSSHEATQRAFALMGWEISLGLVLYASIAGIAYAQRAQARLREETLAAAQARLAALRARLNPHFLFNALHTVAGLIEQDRDAAQDALEHLGALLRYAIKEESRDVVPFADEWRLAERYLGIERTRLGERLRVEALIHPSTLTCGVPPFVLQPLIENAIRHGIGRRPEGGTVTIGALRDDECLRLSVADDGVGAEPQRSATSGGIGLRSIRQRLVARHGEAATMRLTTAPNEGFRVDITLPCEPCTSPR